MNVLKLQTWSERQQVVAIILLAGLVIFLMWFFPLTWLNHRRVRLEKEIEGMRSRLGQRGLLLDETALQERKDEEQKHYQRIHGQWTAVASRISPFPPPGTPPEPRIGLIDFKVALLDVRQRLGRKAQEQMTVLATDLGMNTDVDSTEDAQKLMRQLRTAERFVDLLLDLRVRAIKRVRPLPPIQHSVGACPDAFLAEYPVEIQFEGNLGDLYELLQAVLEPPRVFAVRNLRVEPAVEGRSDVLALTVQASALAFLKDPNEMTLTVKKPEGPQIKQAMGH